MITALNIQAKTPQELTDTLTELASQRYGRQWQTDLAMDIGTSRRTVNNWLEKGPPMWPVLLLYAWANGEAERNLMQNFQKAWIDMDSHFRDSFIED